MTRVNILQLAAGLIVGNVVWQLGLMIVGAANWKATPRALILSVRRLRYRVSQAAEMINWLYLQVFGRIVILVLQWCHA
jgi:hypothetical protein